MNFKLLLLLPILTLLAACGDRDEAENSISNDDVAKFNQLAAEPIRSPDSFHVPKSEVKGRTKLREYVLRLLKKRGETNTSMATILGQIAGETEDFRYMYELGDAKYLSYLNGKNGNKYPGDGPKFKGRGFIHLTGRGNYKEFGRRAGYDLIANPPLAERSDVAYAVMLAYFERKRKGVTGWGYARRGDVLGLTRHINGGTNGLSKRRKYFRKYLAQLNSGTYNSVFGVGTPSASSQAYRRGNI